MPRRDYASAPVILSGVTASDGTVTLVIPTGQLARYDGCIPTVVASAATGLLNVQVTTEPVIGSDLRTATTAARTVTCLVSRANLITTLLVGQNAGLVVAGAGITVRALTFGL